MDGVLSAGIGAFLAGVQVEPAFDADRFTGWEIISFWPDEPRFATVDIIPGDVIKTVNGRSLERPEHVQALWQTLPTAASIDILLVRNGRPFELHYAIVP